MPSRAPAPLVRTVVRSAVTGWIAAFYGALYIHAKADFAATGSLWIFGWPFCALLTVATLTHLWLAGAGGGRFSSPAGWVNLVNDALASPEPETMPPAVITTALLRLPAFPAVDACWSIGLAGAVVGVMGGLEWRI